MELAKTDVQVIQDRLKKAQENSRIEFEVNFGKANVTAEGFMRVMNALSVKMSTGVNDITLDITPDGQRSPRLTIITKDLISQYCRKGLLEEVPNLIAMEKKDKEETHLIENYGINVNLRKEDPIKDAKTVAQQMQHMLKTFRLKQRVTFTSSNSPFKVDCTVVNMQKRGANTVPQSGIFQSQPRYEIEVELVDTKHKDSYKHLVDIVTTIYQNIENTPYPMSLSAKENVIDGYIDLIKDLGFVDTKFKRSPSLFIGPKPMSLSWENVLPPQDGKISILNGYTVTDKADGERVLMYFAEDGRAYVIDTRLNVRYSGITLPEFASSVFDGEYLDTWKVSEDAKLVKVTMAAFLAFDVYFFQKQFVANMALIPNRLDILNQVHVGAPKNSFVQFKKKEFLHDENGTIFENINKILSMDAPYKTDGLIFTPANLAVGANYPNEPANLRGRWVRAMKWKPPEMNTIDFLVRIGADVSVGGNTLKLVTLCVGSNEVDADKVNALSILSSAQKSKVVTSQYVEKEFATTLLPLKDGRCYCKNGEVIMNNTIIEFSYIDGEWSPLRMRHDKTQLFNSTKSISNTANDYNVAKNVMDTVTNPVTLDMLIGKENISYDIDDDAYYMRDTKRSNLESKPTLDFHNYWVKNNMLFRRFKGATSLMELACGKGGDLMKWLKNGFKTVVGVDISEDNLLNPIDGAYARLAKQTNKKGNEKYVFCQWDMSKPFIDGYQGTIRDPIMKSISETVFGLVSKTKIKKDLARFYGIGNSMFDVISCQFSIHYMFESSDSLRVFCDNVASHVKMGGYFIGTCMDGHLVDQMLSKSPTRSMKAKKNDKPIWMITAKYDTFSADSDNIGKKIDVYVESINQIVPEYLVDFNTLTSFMEERNMKLMESLPELGLKVSHGSFKDVFSEMEHDAGRDARARQIIENMTTEEKQFSFLNKWFIFKKV